MTINMTNKLIQHSSSTRMQTQHGFTLIELLVSVTLGLLISAAVIQVFMTSQMVDGVQRSGSEIQSSSIFGLQSIERQVRMVNLGNNGNPITDVSTRGGVVLTTHNGITPLTPLGQTFNVVATVADASGGATTEALDTGYLTVSGGMSVVGDGNVWTGDNNIGNGIGSDQLTFQYKNDISEKIGIDIFDCTGTKVEADDTVIQRYYLAESTIEARYNLMCEAGRIVEIASLTAGGASTYVITDFGNAAGKKPPVVVIDNVDQFSVRLGLSRKQRLTPTAVKQTTTYYDMSIEDYVAITVAKPAITSIRLAVLARGSSKSPEEGATTFKVFGSDQELDSGVEKKVLRRVFETTVLLRNARVMDD